LESLKFSWPPHNYAAAAPWFRVKDVEFSHIIAKTRHTRAIGHFITMVSTFSDARAHAFKVQAGPMHHRDRDDTDRAQEAKSRGGRGGFG
jgi:hypothetical protein